MSIAMTITACGTSDNTAEEAESLDYYDGRTFTILVGASPGGSVDTVARFLVEWLPDHLEGDVTMVVENMPGGGQMIATSHFESMAREGLTAMVLSTTVPLSWLYGIPEVTFDLNDWEPMMTIGGGNIWFANPEYSGINSLDDLLEGNHEPIYLAGDTVSSSDLFDVFSLELLGLEPQMTWGYAGGAEPLVAFQQGETNLGMMASTVYHDQVEPLVESGEAVLLFSMGQVQPDGTVIRDPFWPDVPHIGEVYEMKYGELPSGPLWDATLLGSAIQRTLGRSLWLHGDDPPEAIAAMRAALERLVADRAFLEASRISLGDYPPRAGDEARTHVENSLLSVDESVIEFIMEFARDRYDYDLRTGG